MPADPKAAPVLLVCNRVPLFRDSSKKVPRTNALPLSENLYPSAVSTVACLEFAGVAPVPGSDAGTRMNPSVRDMSTDAPMSQRDSAVPAQAETSGVLSLP